jgi:hypothetical protein
LLVLHPVRVPCETASSRTPAGRLSSTILSRRGLIPIPAPSYAFCFSPLVDNSFTRSTSRPLPTLEPRDTAAPVPGHHPKIL